MHEQFLVFQATYSGIQIATYDCHAHSIAAIEIEKTAASAQIFVCTQELLEKSSLSLNNIGFIGVNRGPAPFTTLRVVLASTNGIAYARAIPLVGVSGLTALLAQEQHVGKTPVALLNAFNNDCYYAYRANDKEVSGCLEITTALARIESETEGPLHFVGNGSTLFAHTIAQKLGQRALFPSSAAPVASLETIAQHALAAYQAGQTTTQLEPLYLKRTV